MSSPAPFADRPAKPQVTRLPDGRIGIFVGGAYQFTDDAGAASLREQIDQLLQPPASRDTFEAADRAFVQTLIHELETVEAGGCAPPELAAPKAAP